jgi:plastocyanin
LTDTTHRLAGPAAFTLASVLLVALTACGAGGSPSASAECAQADANNVIAISAHNLRFNSSCMVAPAGTAFTVRLTNNDGEPHNVTIFRDAGFSDPIVKGDLFAGPNVTKDLAVPELDAGTYYFQCIVHPADMKGTLTVR